MLEMVKTALRIKTTAYDSELTYLIAAAQLDLGIAGYYCIPDAVAMLSPVDRVAVILASDQYPGTVQLLFDTVKFCLSKRLLQHMSSLYSLGTYCV